MACVTLGGFRRHALSQRKLGRGLAIRRGCRCLAARKRIGSRRTDTGRLGASVRRACRRPRLLPARGRGARRATLRGLGRPRVSSGPRARRAPRCGACAWHIAAARRGRCRPCSWPAAARARRARPQRWPSTTRRSRSRVTWTRSRWTRTLRARFIRTCAWAASSRRCVPRCARRPPPARVSCSLAPLGLGRARAARALSRLGRLAAFAGAPRALTPPGGPGARC